MGIKIKRVSLKDCGPIKEFNEDFEDLNVIYGMNESGKSFIVEFLIKTLFKPDKDWVYLRKDIGNGKVKMEIDGNIVEFRLSGSNKLDYYLIDRKGLPPLLARLLVVKSGEVEVNENCLDKKFVKDILSQEKILDSVESAIQSTIKSANIINGVLKIDKKGKGAELIELKEKYNTIQEIINKIQELKISEYTEYKSIEKELSDKIEKMKIAKRYLAFLLYQDIKKCEEEISRYPEDKIYLLEKLLAEIKEKKKQIINKENELNVIIKKTQEIQEIKEKKERMLKAKCFLAYKYFQEVSKRKEELENIPEELINKIELNMIELNRKENELDKLNKTIEELNNKTKEYGWLKSAKENYLKFSEIDNHFNYVNLILIGLSFVGFLIVFFLKNKFLIFIPTLFGIIGFILTILRERKKYIDLLKKGEINIIKAEFKEKFGKELKGITSIDSELESLSEDYNRIKIYNEKKIAEEIEIKILKGNIEKDMKFLSSTDILPEKVNEFITNLKNLRKKLIDEIIHFENIISSLNIKETDYCKEDPGIEYNDKLYEELKTNLSILLNKKEEELKLKEIIDVIKKEISSTIEKIKNTFKDIGEIVEDEEYLEHSFNNIKKIIDEKNKKLIEIKARLDILAVDEKDYVKEDPKIKFSQEELEKLEKKKEEALLKLQGLNNEFQELKSEIIKITDDDITTDWDKLLENLFRKKDEIYEQLKNLEAQIIGKKLIYDAINDLRKEEDEKILESLNSNDISDYIFNLTGKYKRLSIEGNDIKISDDIDEFYIKDISTGAKEQVMLGIRIGFIKKILGKDNIFFILDDAFQHSDYYKRPILIDTLIRLSQDGWQIIYLTMDDNIKDEFANQINLKGFERYKFIKL